MEKNENKVTLNYSEISNPELAQALATLSRSPVPGGVAYNVGKLITKIDEIRKTISDEYMNEVVKPYTKPGASIEDLAVADEHKETVEKLNKEFSQKTVTIELRPIPMKVLESIKITPIEMTKLTPFISF